MYSCHVTFMKRTPCGVPLFLRLIVLQETQVGGVLSDNQKSLLLVEDEAIIALAERQLLERAGYCVTIATSGEKALAAVRNPETPIDLILMDIDLGSGTDGTETALEILKTHDIPVVFLSSHIEQEYVQRTEAITSYGYVVKNCGETVLLASIRMAFRLYQAHRNIAAQNMQMEAANERLRETNEQLIQRKAELKQSVDDGRWWHQLLEYVIRHDPSAIAVLDTQLRFMYVSERFLRDYRVTDREIIGRQHYEVFPEIPQKWRDVHARALAGEALSSESDQFTRPDGRVDHTRWECRPWFLSDGTVGGIIIYTEVITESVRATEESRRNERQLAVTLESIGDAVIATDAEGLVQRMNGVAEQLTGWSREEACGRPLSDVFTIVNARTRRPVQNPVNEVLKTGKVVGLANHTVLIARDGTERQIADSAAPIRRPDGATLGVVLVFRDVTEEYRTREELDRHREQLQRSADYLNAVLQTTIDGFWVVGSTGRLTDVNDAYCRMSGYSRDEIIGLHVNDLDAMEEPQETAARMKRILAAGSELFETRHRRKDGSVFDVEVSVTALQDTAEQKLVCFCRDITASKLARESVQAQKEELEAFFTVALDLLCIADTEGRFLKVNREWERVLGYRAEELQQRKFLEFVHPDDLESTLAAMGQLDAQQQVTGFVNRYRGKDGNYRHIEWRSQPSGTLIYAAARDVTERVEVEEEVRRQLHEKTVLLAETHHRIKNNMASIEALLSEDLRSVTHPEAVAVLRDARAGVSGMRLLYEKMLVSDDFSRTSLRAYLDELVEAVVMLYPERRRIAVETEIDDVELAAERLFPVGIIVNELLTNAMKYAFAGGNQGQVRVTVDRSGKQLTLTVHDNGVGLPEGFDADQSGGFGLMLVRMLSEQINARFSIANSNGTRCTVVFEV